MGTILTLSPSESELHYGTLTLGGVGHPACLCGDEGLEVELVEDEAFDELGIHESGLNPYEGLSGEGRSAFLKGIEVSREAVGGEIFDEIGAEEIEASEVLNVLFREREALKGIDHLLKTCKNSVAARKGVGSVKNIEDYPGVVLLQEISLHHGQFVKVGDQC